MVTMHGTVTTTMPTEATPNESSYLLAVEVCRPIDEVVLFTPCFPPSRAALLRSGVVVRERPLLFEEGYQVRVERLALLLSPATRLVSLATPENPSGVSSPPRIQGKA